MIAEFDSIMPKYVWRIKHDESIYHYLEHNIQKNELINLFSCETKNKVIEKTYVPQIQVSKNMCTLYCEVSIFRQLQ